MESLLGQLAIEGLINKLNVTGKGIGFEFKNQAIKEAILDSGMTLEICTYLDEKRNSKETQIGVHIDWDGIIEGSTHDDVLNEIDVMSLRGNVLTFISCKAGSLEYPKGPQALNEIDVTATKLGGKYAKKVLACSKELCEANLLRAKNMNIKIKYLKDMQKNNEV